jgi:hypothetical protein
MMLQGLQDHRRDAIIAMMGSVSELVRKRNKKEQKVSEISTKQYPVK